jgi:hypothetical protein
VPGFFCGKNVNDVSTVQDDEAYRYNMACSDRDARRSTAKCSSPDCINRAGAVEDVSWKQELSKGKRSTSAGTN